MLILKGKNDNEVIIDRGNITINVYKWDEIDSTLRINVTDVTQVIVPPLKFPDESYIRFVSPSEVNDTIFDIETAIGFSKLPNALVFRGKQAYAIALEMKSYVEQYEVPKKSKENSDPVRDFFAHISGGKKSSNVDVADELLKFKKLLDLGAISPEEYELKKKELLGL